MNAPCFAFAPLAAVAKKISFEELADPVNVVVYAGDAMAENSDTRAILQRAHKVESVPDTERTEQTLYVSTTEIMAGNVPELAREGVTSRMTLVTDGKLDDAPLYLLANEVYRQAPTVEIFKGKICGKSELWGGLQPDLVTYWLSQHPVKLPDEAVPGLNDKPESTTASLLSMAGDHPLAVYSREVADSIQISRDSTFMIGLGLTSAVVGVAYCVKTPWDAELPLGLYVTAEQPPAAGKSGVMSAFQKPFRRALRRMNGDRNNALDAMEAQIEATDDLVVKGELLEQLAHKPKPVMGWISNATPEALEKEAIAPNDGYFASASDERGLLNSAFGLTYGKGSPVNMDAALKGFDGGSYVSVRATRKGFDGEVHGSIVCFAQPGSIESILQASGGTGLAERFLWLSDDHQLGKRNHLKARTKPNDAPFIRLCDEVVKLIPERPSLESLTPLSIPVILMDQLRQAKQQIENELGDEGRFGNDAVRGAAGKFDMQVMKIASILHVSRHLCEGRPVPPNIGIDDFEIALKLCHELLERYRQVLVNKRIIGFGAEADAVIEYLEKFPNGKDFEQAKNSLRSKAAFKGKSTKQINAVIQKLSAANIVTVEAGSNGRKKIRLL
ncbi:TPA: DUF3987 domain-containing protein [Aeromonas hydrophila]|nr:DUF3987 domain-containing protein [Aeromonas hydrophila]HAU4974876.1 DUF3987 domain-containing protein [Aeromonas hydrophila]HAU4984339.1 DUF3987 domain-containing protein [Aeromonas hydrophila]